MNDNSEPEVAEKKNVEPLPVDPEERLDWEFDLGERPPPVWKRKILVRFRTKKPEPMPYPDPDTE